MAPSKKLFQSLAAASLHMRPLCTLPKGRRFPLPATQHLSPLTSISRTTTPSFLRYNSSSSSSSSSSSTREPRPLTNSKPATPEEQEQNRLRNSQEPAYQITFTCKPCSHRSSHRITKHGYHRGTVLIRCPGCQNRHVISDHLKIFMDQRSTLEDILSKKGQSIKKGYLEGDMEWWDDDATDGRKSVAEPGSRP